MTPLNNITHYEEAKESRCCSLGPVVCQSAIQKAHICLLPSPRPAPVEEGAGSVAFCAKCCTIYSDPQQVEAVKDWGECLGCDKLNLLDIDFDPEN